MRLQWLVRLFRLFPIINFPLMVAAPLLHQWGTLLVNGSPNAAASMYKSMQLTIRRAYDLYREVLRQDKRTYLARLLLRYAMRRRLVSLQLEQRVAEAIQ